VTPGPGTLVLDCRGQRCPLPVIALARRITDVATGGEVRVDADDPAAPNDIAAWCRMRGHDYLGVEPQPDGVPGIRVARRT
jgi:tRNA 2-thiouridine synthesizing protein A